MKTVKHSVVRTISRKTYESFMGDIKEVYGTKWGNYITNFTVTEHTNDIDISFNCGDFEFGVFCRLLIQEVLAESVSFRPMNCYTPTHHLVKHSLFPIENDNPEKAMHEANLANAIAMVAADNHINNPETVSILISAVLRMCYSNSVVSNKVYP